MFFRCYSRSEAAPLTHRLRADALPLQYRSTAASMPLMCRFFVPGDRWHVAVSEHPLAKFDRAWPLAPKFGQSLGNFDPQGSPNFRNVRSLCGRSWQKMVEWFFFVQVQPKLVKMVKIGHIG